MRVGICQINSHVGAIEHNTNLVLAGISEAREAGCHLAIFPELAICGSSPLDLVWRPGFVAACEAAVASIRAATKGIGVVVGSIHASPGKKRSDRGRASSLGLGPGVAVYNAAYAMENGKIVGRAAKVHLPSFDVHDDGRYFTPGQDAELFPFRGVRIGINLGEDLWADEGPTKAQAALGADWVVNLSASSFCVGAPAARRRVAIARAAQHDVGIICVNLVGGQDDLVFDGGSFVVRSDGQLLFCAPHFRAGLHVVDVVKASPIPPPKDDDSALLRSALVLGIHDYVKKNGFSSVLLGLSGGIDSALVAALAAEALGPDGVVGAFMPSEFTCPESYEDAREVAQRLGIHLVEIPIVDVHRALRAALPSATGIVDENLQPRARATLLMALANQRNALVLAPGNKSECAVGYDTLYGDTVGALAPIADLYKQDVYRLARAYEDAIPDRVFEKPPSAELRPGQRDEDDLPPYPRLDPLLRELIENNASRDGLIGQGFDERLVDEVLRRYYTNEHKRRQSPPAIKVTAKAFGSGRRMPLTNAYRN